MFGPGGISIWQLLIVLIIVLLLFGTKKLRGMGSDLGSAIKGFRKSVKEETDQEDSEKTEVTEDDVDAAPVVNNVESEVEKNKT